MRVIRSGENIRNNKDDISDFNIAVIKETIHAAIIEERKNLGMELHDSFASHLAALKMKIESEINATKDTKTKVRLNSIAVMAGNIYDEARTKSHQLFYETAIEKENDFCYTIKMIVQNTISPMHYTTEIKIDESAIKKVHLQTKTHLLHIIQEAITNCVKHAMAKKIAVFIYRAASEIILEITDDGKGFDIKKQKPGIGLYSIYNRVDAISGQINILSNYNGTSINITIPYLFSC